MLVSATSFPASSDNPHHIAAFAIGILCHYAFIRVDRPTDIFYLVEKRLRLTASREIRNVSRRNAAFTRRYACVAWFAKSSVAKMHETSSIPQLESRVWSREFSSIGVHVRSV